MKRPVVLINDHQKIEAVYKHTEEYLESDDDLRDQIAAHLLAYHEIGDLVPQTAQNFGSGHFFPYSESYYELESSFELCKQGFYRHSLFALRCVLELGVMGLYYDKDDRAQTQIQKWLRSKERTRRFTQALGGIFELYPFSEFDDRFSFRKRITQDYHYLCNWAHTRGYHFSARKQTGSNFNRFSERSLKRYAIFMKRVVRRIMTMMLLKYPIGMQPLPLWDKFGFNAPAGGFLDEDSQPLVLAVLDDEVRRSLHDISNRDRMVTDTVGYIRAMPNLTREQLEEQKRKLAQSDEQWWGFLEAEVEGTG